MPRRAAPPYWSVPPRADPGSAAARIQAYAGPAAPCASEGGLGADAGAETNMCAGAGKGAAAPAPAGPPRLDIAAAGACGGIADHSPGAQGLRLRAGAA